jgi:hypothetical protein
MCNLCQLGFSKKQYLVEYIGDWPKVEEEDELLDNFN